MRASKLIETVMIDGFWTAIFTSGNLSGGGVVYLSGGNLIGGDSQYFYLGTYLFEPQAQMLTAQIKVVAFVSGAVSVFGVPASLFDIQLEGKVTGIAATARGVVKQLPSVRFSVQLLKRAGTLTPVPGNTDSTLWPWMNHVPAHK